MFDKNYFLTRMRNGESIDQIGQSIADMMNEAVDAYEAEQAAAEKTQAKRDIMIRMAECVQEYAELEGHTDLDLSLSDEDIEDLVQSFTQMFRTLGALKDLEASLNAARPILKADKPTPVFVKPTPKAPKSDDEVLSDFIQSLLG
jgi:glycine cleavage system regulatory protein